jgi:hypothetical protein
LAEERFFLKDYTIPMIQLDPTKVILVFSHIHNTFDKRKLLVNPNPAFVKQTTKTLDDFIRGNNSPFFKDFFINRMDGLLQSYAPGSPGMKPDVIKQTKELEQTLARLQEAEKQPQQQQQKEPGLSSDAPTIIMHQEGKEPVALSNDQVLNIIQTQQTEIKTLTARVAALETEKAKDDAMLQNLISTYIDVTSDGAASNEALVRQCLKDVAERDDKIKKTKALYIKSINESSDLKKQIIELRSQIQAIQGAAFLQQKTAIESATAANASSSGSEPIRLIIDDDN